MKVTHLRYQQTSEKLPTTKHKYYFCSTLSTRFDSTSSGTNPLKPIHLVINVAKYIRFNRFSLL